LAFNHADAEELLQDTMLHAYSGFQTFELGTNFSAWMFRILHNCWCSTYRRRQRRPGEVLTEFLDGDTTQKATYSWRTGSSAEAKALAAFTYSEVHTALGALPTGTREAIYFTIVRSTSPSSRDTLTPKPP
jgi:RNA polymerase sigma-70 factor (ECF subfamily)